MRQLFLNGTIITMEGGQTAEAMLIENDRIKMIGDSASLKEYFPGAEQIDLEKKTVIPAFLDAHGHLSSYAGNLLQINLSQCTSFGDILEELRKSNDELLIAYGYDHNRLKERQHPTKEILDAAFPSQKVVLQHQSGHFGVFSSKALKELHIEGKDQDGVLMENDYMEAVSRIPIPDFGKLKKAYQLAMRKYASYGITTIQEGMMVSRMLPLYKELQRSCSFSLDVVGYLKFSEAELFDREGFHIGQTYHNHLRLGGVKIFLDGSPQGRTAFMKTPYIGTGKEYGISCLSDREVTEALQSSIKNNWQLLSHCNGDAAVEQLLSCAEKLPEKERLKFLRPVIIHAQLMEEAQLPLAKKLGFLPSFFIAHCYYFGDTHRKNFGKARAERISPAKSAADLSIPFTFHQDAPVLEPDMLQTIWCAVNRKTKQGEVLGEKERITVLQALKAVTSTAAYQYGEEQEKGTLTAGKQANFVILDKNPLTVPKEELKDIPILQTFSLGKCIYER